LFKFRFRLTPFIHSRLFVLFIFLFLIINGLAGRAMAADISAAIETGGGVAGNAGTVDTFIIDATNDGEGSSAVITFGAGNAGLTVSSDGLDATNTADFGQLSTIINTDNTGTATLTLNDATNGDDLQLDITGSILGNVATDANDLNIIINATFTNDGGDSQLQVQGNITLGSGTVTLNSDADDIAILNFTGAGAQAMSGVINGAAAGEGQVINVNTVGTVTFNSNIGSGLAVDRVRLETGSTTIFNGSVSASTDIDLNTGNTTTFNGSVTTASLNFSADGTAVIADGQDITGAVNNTTTNNGTLTLSGTTTISSTVGSTGVGLKAISAGTAGRTATFSGAVNTTLLTTSGTGNIALNNSFTGNLNFANGAGALVTLADGFNFTGTITNATTNQGILSVNGTSTFSGDVGSTVAGLNAVNILGSGKTATFNGDLKATTTTISNLATLKFTKAATTVTGVITAAGTTGTLDVGTATVSPTGTVTLGANSTLAITIGTSSGQLNASAAGATFASGTTIAPTVSGTHTAGTIVIVQDDDGDIGLGAGVTTGLVITDNSSSFDFTIAFNGNNLELTSVAVITKLSSNTAAIDAVIATAFASDTSMMNALNGLSGRTKEAALETLAPVVSGGAVVGALSAGGTISNTVSVRIASLRTGISAGQGLSAGDEVNEEKHFWFQGFGTYADQGTRQGITGFTSVTGGFSMGGDKQINNDLVLGLAGSFAYSDVNASLSQNRTTVDSYQATFYGSYELGKYFIDAQVGLAYNDYSGDRFIVVGAVERTAHADYDGYQVSGKVEVGRKMSLPKKVKFTPIIGLGYTHVGIPEYTETGATSSNLNVKRQDYDILNLSFRGEFRRTYETSHGNLTPEVHLGYNYEAFDNSIQNISSFTGGGNTFQTTGFDPENHSFLGGLSVTFESSDNFDFVATYDLESKTDYNSHSFLLKGRWSF